jgi:hypothetical protein
MTQPQPQLPIEPKGQPAPANGTARPKPEAAPATTAIVPADASAGEEPSRALSAFSSEANFRGALRMARALADSSLMPAAFLGNIPNCLIAMELANRIGASVLMVAQNLDVIHGRPSWRAQFLTATVNSSRRFTPLRYRFQGEEGKDSWGCRAVAKDREDGEECLGPLITIAIAKKEGWYDKKGSKWQTLPELMLHYRAAAFWTRVYAPELSLGMGTTEEAIDTWGEAVPETQLPASLAPGSAKALEATLLGKTDSVPPQKQAAEAFDAEVDDSPEPGSDG